MIETYGAQLRLSVNVINCMRLRLTICDCDLWCRTDLHCTNDTRCLTETNSVSGLCVSRKIELEQAVKNDY